MVDHGKGRGTVLSTPSTEPAGSSLCRQTGGVSTSPRQLEGAPAASTGTGFCLTPRRCACTLQGLLRVSSQGVQSCRDRGGGRCLGCARQRAPDTARLPKTS